MIINKNTKVAVRSPNSDTDFFDTVAGVLQARPYAKSVCSIFPLSMESNALDKSMNSSVALKFFARIPSMIRWIVRIYYVVFRFLRKQL